MLTVFRRFLSAQCLSSTRQDFLICTGAYSVPQVEKPWFRLKLRIFRSYADCPPSTLSLQRSFGSRKSCKCVICLRDAEGRLVVLIFCVMLRPNCSVRLCESWSLSAGCLTSTDSFKTYWNYVSVCTVLRGQQNIVQN